MSMIELQQDLQSQELMQDTMENYIPPIFRIERVVRIPAALHREDGSEVGDQESEASQRFEDEYWELHLCVCKQ